MAKKRGNLANLDTLGANSSLINNPNRTENKPEINKRVIQKKIIKLPEYLKDLYNERKEAEIEISGRSDMPSFERYIVIALMDRMKEDEFDV